jgi:hypothetical protein
MGRGREEEIRLIKNNVSGDDDVVGGEIETPVAFVSNFGGEIRIAGLTNHVKVLIRGGDSMEGEVWTDRADQLGGEAVQQICGGVEPFYPVASQNRNMKKHGTHHIIDGVKHAFNFTVPRRSVWIKHPQKYPFGGKECVRGGIIELTAIVTLDDFDGATKLCGDISDFLTKWKKC